MTTTTTAKQEFAFQETPVPGDYSGGESVPPEHRGAALGGSLVRVRAMEHAHHEGMMHGDSGAAMGGMSGGMPVAFDWGTRVTLFFHSWETETTFDYLVALIGVFLLCVAQEHLFYFRTSLRLGEGAPARDVDHSAPILPKPYKCVPGSSLRVGVLRSPLRRLRPTGVCPSRARVPLARSRFSDRHSVLGSSNPQRADRAPARRGDVPVRREPRVELPHHAGGDVVQRRRVFLGARRAERRAFFVRVKAPHRRGGGDLGGLPPRVLAPHAPGALTRRSR